MRALVKYAHHAERRKGKSKLDQYGSTGGILPIRAVALEECLRETELADEMAGAAGVPNRKRIASRFVQFLKKPAQSPGATLLKGTYEYLVTEKGVDENELVYEWAEGVIGDQYPVPDRILKYTEMLVRDYLDKNYVITSPLREYSIFSLPRAELPPCVISSIPCSRISC